MTLDDLEVIRYDAYWDEYDKCPDIEPQEKHVRANRAGIRAVVVALRNHFSFVTYPHDDWDCISIEGVFDEILASDGVDKAAGGKPQADFDIGSAGGEPGSTPAADVDVDQRIEHGASTSGVAGSSPAVHSNYTGGMNDLCVTPAADTNASAVCEWVAVHLPDRVQEFQSQCGSMYVRVAQSPHEQGAHHCYRCGKPVKFRGADK